MWPGAAGGSELPRGPPLAVSRLRWVAASRSCHGTAAVAASCSEEGKPGAQLHSLCGSRGWAASSGWPPGPGFRHPGTPRPSRQAALEAYAPGTTVPRARRVAAGEHEPCATATPPAALPLGQPGAAASREAIGDGTISEAGEQHGQHADTRSSLAASAILPVAAEQLCRRRCRTACGGGGVRLPPPALASAHGGPREQRRPWLGATGRGRRPQR